MLKIKYICTAAILSFLSVLVLFTKNCRPEDSTERVSNTRAKKKCRDLDAELASYSDITKESITSELMTQLNNGESAWIKGFAKFSSPIAFRGCYQPKLGYESYIHSEPIGSASLYSCVNLCQHNRKYTNYQTDYIGLRNITCLCLNELVLRNMRAVTDSSCNNNCSNQDINTCGGVTEMSVYEIFRETTLKWAKNEPSKRQCIYVNWGDTKPRQEVFTTSCYILEHKPNIYGYICKNTEYSPLDKRCWIRDTSKRYCFKGGSVTRQAARDGCLIHNGVLADIEGLTYAAEILKANYSYWVGIYRAFAISEEKTDYHDACLAVTKVHDKFYLDPDSCDKKNYYLCKRNHREGSETRQVTEQTPADTDRNVSRSSEPALSISLTSLILVILFGIIFAVHYNIKKLRCKATNSSVYLTPTYSSYADIITREECHI